MDFDTSMIVFMVLAIVLLLASFALPVLAFRRWRLKGAVLGCLAQFVVFLLTLTLLFGVFIFIDNAFNTWNSMLVVSNVEEDQCCRYEQTWYLKPDGTVYYKYDKGSHDHAPEPCGNDSHSATFEIRRDSSSHSLSVMGISCDLYLSVDVKNHTISPIGMIGKTEVLKVDWEQIEEYLNNEK